MKTRRRLLHCAFLSVCIFSLASLAMSAPSRADELVSLDDPAPTATAVAKPPAAADSLESLDGSAATGGAEVALDLSAGENTFNPYLFSRNTAWGLLPLLSLILLGLHLIPVPKRKSIQKIDQAQRFFQGANGEKTGFIERTVVTTPKPAPVAKGHGVDVDEKTPVGEAKTRVFIPPGGSKIFIPKGEED